MVALDLACVAAAYLILLVFRFGGAVPPHYWRNFLIFTPIAAFVHVATNYLFGLYGQMWRYASVQEARRLVLATAMSGGLVIFAGVGWVGSRRPLPASVVVLATCLSFLGFGTIRFQRRLFGFRRRTVESGSMRVLLIGAGDAGAMLLRDILNNPSLQMDPVGFVDDDPRKLGLSIHGVRVLGDRDAIPGLARRHGFDQALLAIPSATSWLIRECVALCEQAGVSLRLLPSMKEIVGGKVSVRDVRDLSIEDLLGRKQVETDLEAVRTIIAGRRVLVTGGGGSIGRELAHQVAAFGPSELLLLDHDETHLHEALIELDGASQMRLLLADVRDRDRLFGLFRAHAPEVVFHAAAHKHVPMLEEHPDEAFFTNVLGTANVADAALASGTDRFVLISTDKAVRPVSVMGASKWLAEQVIRSYGSVRCRFCAVRFGNVLGSRGSVIPTFLRQIALGRPITVTDPAMTRYFMSLHEAVQLVLQAAALSRGDELFTLDMGEPVKILDLARNLVRLSGKVPGKDVPIVIVGPRPGERLLEQVLDEHEKAESTSHPGVFVSRGATLDLVELRSVVRELEGLASQGGLAELAERMKAVAVGLSPVVAGART
ncbi:MAG: polysaccharide biosynthesis protein [Actinomycetota bacterium]